MGTSYGTAYIPAALVDAKGDVITATANDVPSRLAVGADGEVLTADSAEATGLKWAVAAVGTPTVIGAGETFTVPADTQVLFSVPIDASAGTLIINGVLVEVN